MKARIPFKTSNPSGHKAMMEEIKRQCIEMNKDYEFELDSLVLFTLAEKYGFRKKRLDDFYKELLKQRRELHKYYAYSEAKDNDAGIEYIAAKHKLNNSYGYDVEENYNRIENELNREDNSNELCK